MWLNYTLFPLEVQLILHGSKPQLRNDMVDISGMVCLITTNYLGTVNSKILLSLWKFQDTSQEPRGKASQLFIIQDSVQFSSVAQSYSTLWHHGCSTPGFPVHHQLPELAQTMSIELVMPSNHLILCCPLLLPLSVFPSIRVFSNESVLCIRWPKYWSFSFSISPSNKYSGLIPLGWIGWISLQSKGLSRVFSNTTV